MREEDKQKRARAQQTPVVKLALFSILKLRRNRLQKNVVEHSPLSIIEDKICVGSRKTKTSMSATHTCQARTTLCIEVEKESTSKSVLRKAVEHFPLSIIENEICVGDGISIAIAILSARRDCVLQLFS